MIYEPTTNIKLIEAAMNVLDVSYNHIYFHPCVHSSIGQCGGLLSRCVCSTLHLPVELFRVCDEERASEGLAALS